MKTYAEQLKDIIENNKQIPEIDIKQINLEWEVEKGIYKYLFYDGSWIVIKVDKEKDEVILWGDR